MRPLNTAASSGIKKTFIALGLTFASLAAMSGSDLLALGAYVQGNVHAENRDSTTKKNFDGQIGVDFNLLGPIYLGPRLGYYDLTVVDIPSTGTKHKLSGGAHAYALLPLGPIAIKGGVASDLVAGDNSDAVYFYMGVEAGLRLNVLPLIYAEIPVEVGMFPAFDGKIAIYKLGLQAGVSF